MGSYRVFEKTFFSIVVCDNNWPAVGGAGYKRLFASKKVPSRHSQWFFRQIGVFTLPMVTKSVITTQSLPNSVRSAFRLHPGVIRHAVCQLFNHYFLRCCFKLL